MLNNNKGMTLVELLGALVISAILFGFLFSIVEEGTKSYKNDLTANRLQTDVNLIISTITTKFYKHHGQQFDIHLQNGKVFSDGKNQAISSGGIDYTGSTFTWKDRLLTIHIIAKSRDSQDTAPLELDTTLNYPWKENKQ